MPEIDLERMKEYRTMTFRFHPNRQLRSAADALAFVEERSFVFFWRIQGVVLPSLWAAVAGDRPVPNNHDDPAHVTWDWKDGLLDKRCWYYSRLLRRRNTILSLEAAAYFYALTPNYGDYENDYLELYESGEMTLAARQVYEALLREGALDSLALRKAAHLSSRESSGRFARALDDLQINMMVMPVGVARAGRWNYAFVYDVSARHLPDLPQRARFIGEEDARDWLLRRYYLSLGAAPVGEAARLFGWGLEATRTAQNRLLAQGIVAPGGEVSGSKGEWLALPELLV